jgi:23S rRNA (cytidine2498-2'-O)-methyltransferase
VPADAAHQLAYHGAQRLHVFAREPERMPDLTSWQQAIALPGGLAQPGELVADVVVADGEPAWLGLHRQDEHHLAWPGGAIAVDMPAASPSRAYAKIEEAIAWAHLPVEKGQVAVEIGAAPGGAVLALARRGLEVWGVDTGDLAPAVLATPGVHHLKMKVGALRWEELPERVDWLLVDVNLAPQVALHEVGRLMPRLKKTLRGAVITLKLNDWTFIDELPTLVARIQQLGLPRVQLRHLPSNRREVCAVAQRA